jgi:hypothetical protein
LDFLFLECARGTLGREVSHITTRRTKKAKVWLAIATAAITLLAVLAQLGEEVIGILSHH